ncbi:hypothetical protein HOY82DRAFT_667633 [Tuber indicum]|nr:hypothetical protein HOY82DRAFT_667633 [Tuber indicum]
MFRFASKQVFKPKAIHHRHHDRLFPFHHPCLLRGASTTQISNKDNRSDTDRTSRLTESSGGSKSHLSHVLPIPCDRFGRLIEDVSILKAKVAHLEAGQNRIASDLKDLRKKLDADLKDISDKMDMVIKGQQSKIRDLSNKIRRHLRPHWEWIKEDYIFILLFFAIVFSP